MKKVLLFSLLMMITACGSKVSLEAVEAAAAVCVNNGGTDYLRVTTQPTDYMYVNMVRCKDGARFDDTNLWNK